MELLYLPVRTFQLDLRHGGVECRVVADGVPLIYHTLNQLRAGIKVGKRYEEGRADILFLQNIKYLRGVAVFVALIKGEVHGGHVRVLRRDRPELRIIGLPLFRTEPAVAVRVIGQRGYARVLFLGYAVPHGCGLRYGERIGRGGFPGQSRTFLRRGGFFRKRLAPRGRGFGRGAGRIILYAGAFPCRGHASAGR